MASQITSTPSPLFLEFSDENFLANLQTFSKFKQRSHQTYQNVHLPELNARLNLNLEIPTLPAISEDDPFAPHPDLSNTSKIEVVYLGNSMLERLKTTGRATNLGRLQTAWNAGCGGDKNENVLYRLLQGTYTILKKAQSQEKRSQSSDIKLWILVSGTNNLHPKRPFQESDIASYRRLVKACLKIAPASKVLAGDMFYRKDIPDEIVENSNEMLKCVVEQMNNRFVENGGQKRILWVEARDLVGKDVLVDHVHLNEDGYNIWDGVLWPVVEDVLGWTATKEGNSV